MAMEEEAAVSLWVVCALFFAIMLLLSGAGASEKTPPQQVCVLQVSPQPQQGETGCLPLLLFIAAIVAAATLL